jgi:hypothetical protein
MMFDIAACCVCVVYSVCAPCNILLDFFFCLKICGYPDVMKVIQNQAHVENLRQRDHHG